MGDEARWVVTTPVSEKRTGKQNEESGERTVKPSRRSARCFDEGQNGKRERGSRTKKGKGVSHESLAINKRGRRRKKI